MKKEKLQAILKNEITTATGYVGGELSEERRKAMEYYLGEPFGNEVEGRSSVVSTDVQDTIESMMPDFMEIFAGGDRVVRFEAVGPEDEPFAEQATDYVNYIWSNDNDGFSITHDWIKDALLQKNGIIKVHWEEKEGKTRETLENVDILQLQELTDDESIEIIEYDSKPDELGETPDGLLHDLTFIKTEKTGKVCVSPVPPDEFLISRRAANLVDAPFTCHRTRKTVSDLLEMGFSKAEVEDLPSVDGDEYNEERVARFSEDEWDDHESLDPSMREIWLYECYLKTDYDGDGIAEMRMVTCAGPSYKILENVPVDEHPFEFLTPIKMPHKFFGRAVADLVMDVQLIKSTIQRQLLDNMYGINNGRSAINDRVNIDDYLTNRPNGVVRVEGAGSVGDAIMPLTTQPLGPAAFSQLEYWDQVRESRTSVTRLNQGLDADALNKTAYGMNQLMGRTQRRMLLIARMFAELGFKSAFSKILRLVVTRQDRERIIKLRNQWVPMDPRSWNTDMDVSVSVGLGYGTKEQQAALMQALMEIQEKAIAFQGGVEGPLVNLENIHNTVTKFVHAMGERDARLFFTDPKGQPMPQKPPPPEMVKLQAEQQLETQKLQQDMQKFMEELKFKYAELEMKYSAEASRQDINASKVAVDAAQAAAVSENQRAEIRIKGEANERNADAAESD